MMSLLTGFICMLRDLHEQKYYFLIQKREDARINHSNDSKAIIKCSQCMGDVYNNMNDSNPVRKINRLIVFSYMIADIMNNKKFQAIIKELFI